jgi:hypothetical protein
LQDDCIGTPEMARETAWQLPDAVIEMPCGIVAIRAVIRQER